MEMRSQIRRRQKKSRRWLVVILVILVVIGVVWQFFAHAMAPLQQAEQKYERIATRRFNLVKTDHFYQVSRNGKTYYSVVGENKNKQDVAVIFGPSNHDKGKKISLQGKQTATTVRNKVKREYDPKHITSLGLAVYQDVPVWKVTFIDHHGNLNFITYQVSNGKAVQTIRNL